MAVLSVTTLHPKPDSYEAFLETQRRAKTVLERCGATNCRTIAAMAAGEASGSIVSTWEAPDFATQGKILDKFLADPEGMALMMESGTSAGPVTGFQSSVWVDVPL